MTLCLLPMALIGLGIIIAIAWGLVGFGYRMAHRIDSEIRKQIRRLVKR